MNIPFPWFVFDVESIGLFGDPFAVGWVVLTEEGKEISAGWIGTNFHSMDGDFSSKQWCKENIPQHILAGTVNSLHSLYEDFARQLSLWQKEKASIISDVPFPVESNFLLKLFREYTKLCESPYPLYDVATALATLGKDPLAEYPRKENEIKHDPLGDARQSARILYESFVEWNKK